MNNLLSILDCLRKGSAVADPKLWKDRAALAIALSALITSAAHLAKAFGYDVGIDTATADQLAGGIAAVAGVLSTYATSDKVGLPGLAPVARGAGDAAAAGVALDPAPPRSERANPAAAGTLRPSTGAPTDSSPYLPG